ncbi:MAG: hypothetical protein ACRD3Z_02710 [Nitrososphaerales archaeon]
MTEQKSIRLPNILTIGYLLAGIGALLQIGSGQWDVTWHSLDQPETFFTPPHTILYTGVVLSLSMGILAVVLRVRHKVETRFVRLLQYALIGSLLQVFSGSFDSWWHANFGFDGLLSPPHAVLVSGMIINAYAGAVGLAKISSVVKPTFAAKTASIISFTALWMSSVGMVMLFTLPFSDGDYFNFNPDPTFAVVLASIALPIIGPLMITLFSRTISIAYPATVLTASYIAVNGITTIAAHYAIAPALPYYAMNILIAVALDFVLKRDLSDKVKAALTGAIIGPFFYTLYFPLVTHAFREFLGFPVDVFITTVSLFQVTYAQVMVSTFIPAVLLGFVGSLIAHNITRKYLKTNT